MQLTEDKSDAVYQIKACLPGSIQINENIYTHSLVISADYLNQHWNVTSSKELTPAHLEILLERNPDIVIIGTGNQLVYPSGELLQVFYSRKIGVEVMNTPAACRTCVVLMTEGRNVVAGLII